MGLWTALNISFETSFFEGFRHTRRILTRHSRVDRHFVLQLRFVLFDRRDLSRHALQQRSSIVAIQPLQRLGSGQFGERPRGFVAIWKNGMRSVLRTLQSNPSLSPTSSNSSSTISFTMCRIECIGSDMIFTFAVTDRPVVPTSSSTSSTIQIALLSHFATAASRGNPLCAATPTRQASLKTAQRPRKPRRTAFGR